MTIKVYDYRKDIGNVVIHPELRGRFKRMDPEPAGLMHSHDLGGEIFIVLEGTCEFLVEDEKVTCTPGQLIYVEPRLKHTLHAVGDGPCVVYLSVTPHVDPTHTMYDEEYRQLPPNYQGIGLDGAAARPELGIAELADRYLQASRILAELSTASVRIAEEGQDAIKSGEGDSSGSGCKEAMDQLWYGLRSVLEQVSIVEREWNLLAPRSMRPGQPVSAASDGK